MNGEYHVTGMNVNLPHHMLVLRNNCAVVVLETGTISDCIQWVPMVVSLDEFTILVAVM
jgi:hypothetical protein